MPQLAELYAVKSLLIDGQQFNPTTTDDYTKNFQYGSVRYILRSKRMAKMTGHYWFYELRVVDEDTQEMLFFCNRTNLPHILDQYIAFADEYTALYPPIIPQIIYDSIW